MNLPSFTKPKLEEFLIRPDVPPGSGRSKFDWLKVQKAYDNGHTIRALIALGFNSKTLDDAVKAGRLKTRNASEALKYRFLRHPHPGISADTRKKIGLALKKAHAEGRGHNIGKCRWMKQPSYPESFFVRVISNENLDPSYVREYWMGGFVMDFAWPARKKVIEIDGDQHQRFQEVKERDARKDAYLTSIGWQVLRIPWRLMYADPRVWILKAQDFLPL